MNAESRKVEQVLPYGEESSEKKEQLRVMFDRIAPVYDRANHLFSFQIDKSWRKGAIRSLRRLKPLQILDVATGTGDFALEAAAGLEAVKVTGIDISEGMMYFTIYISENLSRGAARCSQKTAKRTATSIAR